MPMTCLIVSGWLSTASSPPAITPANHSSRRICLGELLAPAKAPLLSLDRHVRCRASEDEQPGHHWPARLPAPRPYESLVNRLQGEPGCFFVFRSSVIGEGPRPLLSPLHAGADLLINRCAVMLVQLGGAAVLSARQKTGRSAAVSSAAPHDRRDLHSRRECPASMQPRQAGQEHGNQSDMDAVAGSHVGSQRRERLPTTGGRVRTGSWRSCQLADRSGRR